MLSIVSPSTTRYVLRLGDQLVTNDGATLTFIPAPDLLIAGYLPHQNSLRRNTLRSSVEHWSVE